MTDIPSFRGENWELTVTVHNNSGLLFCCLSVCLCERGRAAGSDEATHTLLERNDHLSPSDSQGYGYQSKGRKAQRDTERERLGRSVNNPA